jgi:hypothetical protein
VPIAPVASAGIGLFDFDITLGKEIEAESREPEKV